jgi:hypothetical protein
VRPVRRLRRRGSGLQGRHRPALKQAGMHRTTGGADAIMTPRCQQAIRPEDQIW